MFGIRFLLCIMGGVVAYYATDAVDGRHQNERESSHKTGRMELLREKQRLLDPTGGENRRVLALYNSSIAHKM